MKRSRFSEEQISMVLKEAETGLRVAVRWSVISSRRLRLLTMVNGWDRCCPQIEIDHSLTGEREILVLARGLQSGVATQCLGWTESGDVSTGSLNQQQMARNQT